MTLHSILTFLAPFLCGPTREHSSHRGGRHSLVSDGSSLSPPRKKDPVLASSGAQTGELLSMLSEFAKSPVRCKDIFFPLGNSPGTHKTTIGSEIGLPDFIESLRPLYFASLENLTPHLQQVGPPLESSFVAEVFQRRARDTFPALHLRERKNAPFFLCDCRAVILCIRSALFWSAVPSDLMGGNTHFFDVHITYQAAAPCGFTAQLTGDSSKGPPSRGFCNQLLCPPNGGSPSPSGHIP